MIFWLFVIFLCLYGAKRGERTNFGVIPEGAKGGGQGGRKIARTHTHTTREHTNTCAQTQGWSLRVKAFRVWGFP